jgi:hypothetical protein
MLESRPDTAGQGSRSGSRRAAQKHKLELQQGWEWVDAPVSLVRWPVHPVLTRRSTDATTPVSLPLDWNAYSGARGAYLVIARVVGRCFATPVGRFDTDPVASSRALGSLLLEHPSHSLGTYRILTFLPAAGSFPSPQPTTKEKKKPHLVRFRAVRGGRGHSKPDCDYYTQEASRDRGREGDVVRSAVQSVTHAGAGGGVNPANPTLTMVW